MSTQKTDHGKVTPAKAHVFSPRGVRNVEHPTKNLTTHPGQTAHFRVSVDSALGSTGTMIADTLLTTCEQDFATLQIYFGGITPASLPFHLILTSGSQGASHATCAATALSIGANSGPVP